MIYGIGIDMVEITRIEKASQRWGDRFLKRVFTEVEIEYCYNMTCPSARFALRFAAKEAFSKALGLGIGKGVNFRQIEVMNAPNGQPYLNLYGRAKELCNHHGVKKSHLSLSDEGLYALAVVILEV
jgi:holo-[acyl-carrier protein] synthase